MSYQVLARKWRPRRFEDLVGQEHVVRALINGLDNDRLHHAFLFTGTRGVGKTTIARILAKSLNCEKGVSSKPCGECSACREVDEGRFVDLIEVDAASRTKVDDTRELLDNVQFAPTRGRYKVYLIDEVHMLSGHSFNALLKTLEEPPPHVKFLLATTDPQRLPVTVLSRCLQFSLKHLSAEQIDAQLNKIIASEGIEAEPAALTLIARSAAGSMRDGLSLLDQAIAYTGGKLEEAPVREMLGTIDQQIIQRMLSGLASHDAAELIAAVGAVAEQGMDFGAALEELLIHLHRIAMAQVDPKLVESFYDEEKELALSYAQQIPGDDVQLFYQIGIKGRQDISLAPNPRMGLEMVLLRMHGFSVAEQREPTAGSTEPAKAATKVTKSPAASSPAPAAKKASPEPPKPAVSETSGDYRPASHWPDIVAGLALGGLSQQLADNAVMDSKTDSEIVLTLDKKFAQLHNAEREADLQQALRDYFGNSDLKLGLSVGTPGFETPAAMRKRQTDERQQAAEQAISTDPNVKALQDSFQAEVNTGSVRPRN